MKVERMLVATALIVGLTAGPALAAAAETSQAQPLTPKGPPKPAIPKPPTQEEMMANWAKAKTPGEPHKVLESFVGRWSSHVKMQMDPGQPVQESDGTAEGTMVLGGRYVQVVHHGTVMGEPFEGIMLSGYDNLAKKYVATWVDNMGTSIVHYDGSFDKNTKRLMMGARFIDPMTGKPMKTRTVTAFLSPTSWTYEEYAPGAGGKERLVMLITFTKKA
jgi:hypothetical protein